MPVLHVIGDRPGAGKTCFIGALLSPLAREGRLAGYCRPFSAAPRADPDVAFFARYLPAAPDDIGTPPLPDPQPLPRAALDDAALQAAVDAVAALPRLAGAGGLVLVEGPDLAPAGEATSPLAPGLAAMLAARLESQAVLVFRYAPGLTAAQVAQAAAPLGRHLAGIVINGVTRHRWHQVQQGLLAELRAQGLPVLGALPEDRAMLAVTVNQIAGHLAGRFIDAGSAGQEPENGEAWVERFLLGGNIMDSGAIYFGRLPNQAVITRAARPDIQLAALTPNTRCLVLTGGGEPTEYIRVEARQRAVPLILAPGDTLATVAALEGLRARATAYSQHKLERFHQLMAQHLELGGLELGR